MSLMSSEWLTQTLTGDHRPLRALQAAREKKKFQEFHILVKKLVFQIIL